MPELPEVETTKKALETVILNHTVSFIKVLNPNLRWRVDTQSIEQLTDIKVIGLGRRGKYLIFEFSNGYAISHLGMSGHWRYCLLDEPLQKHDHIEICFSKFIIRYHDPRRFGSFHWCSVLTEFPLFKQLGVEPIDNSFAEIKGLSQSISDQQLCWQLKQSKKTIKSTIMDSRLLVGVGNIYANESLFLAAINPQKSANQLSIKRISRLLTHIKAVLKDAIALGGTTLKDFVSPDSLGQKTGYFQNQLNIYGREGLPCHNCQILIKKVVIGQRSTFYCPSCQRY